MFPVQVVGTLSLGKGEERRRRGPSCLTADKDDTDEGGRTHSPCGRLPQLLGLGTFAAPKTLAGPDGYLHQVYYVVVGPRLPGRRRRGKLGGTTRIPWACWTRRCFRDGPTRVTGRAHDHHRRRRRRHHHPRHHRHASPPPPPQPPPPPSPSPPAQVIDQLTDRFRNATFSDDPKENDAVALRAGLELGLWKSLATTANIAGLSLTTADHGAFLIQVDRARCANQHRHRGRRRRRHCYREILEPRIARRDIANTDTASTSPARPSLPR